MQRTLKYPTRPLRPHGALGGPLSCSRSPNRSTTTLLSSPRLQSRQHRQRVLVATEQSQQHQQQPQQQQQQQQGIPAGPTTSSNSSHVAQVKRHLEAVLAEAAGSAEAESWQTSSTIQHLGVGAICHSRAFAYSEERIVVVRLASDCPTRPQEVASKMAQRMHRDADFVSNVAPSASGRCLQLVGCEQAVANNTVASRVMPVTARHGWAGSNQQQHNYQAKATAADKPLCTTVVFLAAGDPDLLELCDLDEASEGMQDDGSLDAEEDAGQQHCADVLLRAQQVAKAWLDTQQAATAAGISSSNDLPSMLLLADTFAGVASQLTLLPLADASGLPHLALFAARAVVNAIRAEPQALDSLKRLNPAVPAAAAWAWWACHGAGAAAQPVQAAQPQASGCDAGSDSSDGEELTQGDSDSTLAASLAAADRGWLQDLMKAAANVVLAAKCPLPVLQPESMGLGALPLSFWHRFAGSSGGATGYLFAFVPKGKRSTGVQLSTEQLSSVCLGLSSAGAELCCSPLLLRERLCSRTGVLLLPVRAKQELEQEKLDELLTTLGGKGYAALDVSNWRPAGVHQHKVLPPAREWDDLARCINVQLIGRRAASSTADAAEPFDDEYGDLVDSFPYSSLVQLAVSSTELAALSKLLEKVDTMAGPAAASNDTSSSSSSSSSYLGYQQCPELKQLLADRQQIGSRTNSSARHGRIHLYARTSSREAGGTVSASVNAQTAASTAAVAQVLHPCTGLPEMISWQETCSVYKHRPAERTVLRQMLAQLQQGDAVVVASPDRLARNEADFCWIVQQLRAKGTALLAVAVGQHALLPLVLLDDGGQPLYAPGGSPLQQHEGEQQQQDEDEEQQQLQQDEDDDEDSAAAEPGACSVAELLHQVLPTVCRLLETVCWATSAQQAQVSAQHAFMARQLTADAACGAVSDLLRALLTPATTHIFTRVSESMPQGVVQGMVGGLALTDLDTGSLARQHQFCAMATGLQTSQGVTLWQHNGQTAHGQCLEDNPMLQLVMQFPLQQGSADTGGVAADSVSEQRALQPAAPAAVVIATSLCRISRRAGLLQKFRQEAQQRNVRVMVLLHASSVLDAVQQMSEGRLPIMQQPAWAAPWLPMQAASHRARNCCMHSTSKWHTAMLPPSM